MSDAPTEIKPEQAWEERLFRHDRQLLHCRFSPCGRFLFAAGTDSLVHRWMWKLPSTRRWPVIRVGSGRWHFIPMANT